MAAVRELWARIQFAYMALEIQLRSCREFQNQEPTPYTEWR